MWQIVEISPGQGAREPRIAAARRIDVALPMADTLNAARALWRVGALSEIDRADRDRATWIFGAGPPIDGPRHTLRYAMSGRYFATCPGDAALGLAPAPHSVFQQALTDADAWREGIKS